MDKIFNEAIQSFPKEIQDDLQGLPQNGGKVEGAVLTSVAPNVKLAYYQV